MNLIKKYQAEKLKNFFQTINDSQMFKKISPTIDKDRLLQKTGYNNSKIVEYLEQSQEYAEKQGFVTVSDQLTEETLKKIRVAVDKDKVQKNKKALFVLGLPGAGKSTWIKNFEKTESEKYQVVDSDDFLVGIKNDAGEVVIPPLQNPDLEGTDIEAVQPAASRLAKMTIAGLMKEGYNIVFPKLGDDLSKLKGLFSSLQEKGYTLTISFIFTTVETSLRRNADRFLHDPNEIKRLVPPEVIVKCGYKPLLNFVSLTSNASSYKFQLWDGDKDGVAASLVWHSK